MLGEAENAATVAAFFSFPNISYGAKQCHEVRFETRIDASNFFRGRDRTGGAYSALPDLLVRFWEGNREGGMKRARRR